MPKSVTERERPPAAQPRKLSYKEQRELAGLPSVIETLETDIAALNDEMGQPKFYQQPKDFITQSQTRLTDLQCALEMAYHRWEALEARQEAAIG